MESKKARRLREGLHDTIRLIEMDNLDEVQLHEGKKVMVPKEQPPRIEKREPPIDEEHLKE